MRSDTTKSDSGMLISDLRLRIIPGSRFGTDAHVYASTATGWPTDIPSLHARTHGHVAYEGCACHPFRGAGEVRVEPYRAEKSFPFRPVIMRSPHPWQTGWEGTSPQ